MSQNTTLNNALMSDATYIENITKGKLTDEDFSERLAGDFLDAFSVIDQAQDNASGFQGTVFQNTTTGVYTIAFAGTDSESPADIRNDLDIATRGMATEQFIHAYNYYQQMTNYSEKIPQISGLFTEKPVGKNYVAQALYLTNPNGSTTKTEEYYVLEEINNPGIQQIPSGSTIEFTGHSLGGHLAGLMSMITGKQATVFNAPGYQTGIIPLVNILINSSVDCLIVNLLGGQVNQSGVTHFMNDDFVSLAANYGITWSNTTDVDCLYSGINPFDHHGIANLVVAFLAQDKIKGIVNEECFIDKTNDIGSENAINNVYAMYCLENKKNIEKLDFLNYVKIQEILFDIEMWINDILRRSNELYIKVVLNMNKFVESLKYVVVYGV